MSACGGRRRSGMGAGVDAVLDADHVKLKLRLALQAARGERDRTGSGYADGRPWARFWMRPRWRTWWCAWRRKR